MRRALAGILVGSILAFGCGKRDVETPPPPEPASVQASPQAATTPEAAPAPEAAPEPAADPTSPPIPTDAVQVPGVPDLSLAWPSPKAEKAANDENRAGLKLHKKNTHAAIERYLAALRHDPSHSFARYNLACAYGLVGDADRAIGVLRQFRAAACVTCMKRLAKAATDSDFDSIRDLEAFQQVIANVVVREPDYAKAAQHVTGRLAAQDFSPLLEAIAAGRHVTIDGEQERLDDSPNPRVRFDIVSSKEIARLKKTVWEYEESEDGPQSGFRAPEEVHCKDQCCTFEALSCGGADDLTSRFTEICFVPLTADKAVPSRIKFFTCGG